MAKKEFHAVEVKKAEIRGIDLQAREENNSQPKTAAHNGGGGGGGGGGGAANNVASGATTTISTVVFIGEIILEILLYRDIHFII